MATIIIADDDKTTNVMLTKILEKAGHLIISLPDGKRVMQTIKDENPDLLITDIIMPEKEGIETIIETREIYSDLPIIAISQNAEYLELAVSFDISEKLLKPISTEALLSAVDSALN